MSEWEKKIRKNLCSNCFQAPNCSDHTTFENCNETNFVVNILKREIANFAEEIMLGDRSANWESIRDALEKRGI